VHYQPKMQLATGRVTGLEALLRWTHPRLGPIPPAEFVDLAERTGLIKQLSRFVLETVLSQQRIWWQSGLKLPVAINLSMRDLQDDDLPRMVQQILSAARLPASALAVEVTESTLMVDPESTRNRLQRLRDLGIRIAVDDFGTGYSSLAYLKHLPVDELKIDRSFVRDIHRDSTDRIIVESIIGLAHNLGLMVVAEGVEEAATSTYLRQLRCDEAQGYYFGRPASAASLILPGWPALRPAHQAAA
jgi:EAL domain-containing protein (putative c-di-GMP-specific phosphodiesterase class I)